jgi:L-ascorbate metabolism protein UlaG (beta-lactamase superfamily)
LKQVFRLMMASLTITIAACATPTNPNFDPRSGRPAGSTAAGAADRDPGCTDSVLVSTGGAFPRNPRTLAIRWTGFSNFELAHNGQVILLDTYFDRGSVFPPLGFKAADVKRADLILIGHGHVDHMSDAASVGARTGAPVVGAAVTTEKLLTQSINPAQVRTVTGRGGELLRFPGYTVEPILGRHGEPPAHVVTAFQQALRATTKPPTPEQTAELGAIRQRGIAGDPRVITEGTIAYLITLDNGFRVLFRDSGGRITEHEKAVMARVGRVDVALVAVSASLVQELTVPQALEHARTYKPDVYIPSHHDGSFNTLWRATEPLFQALKDENPDIIAVSRGYREPICFDTENNIERRRKSN